MNEFEFKVDVAYHRMWLKHYAMIGLRCQESVVGRLMHLRHLAELEEW